MGVSRNRLDMSEIWMYDVTIVRKGRFKSRRSAEVSTLVSPHVF